MYNIYITKFKFSFLSFSYSLIFALCKSTVVSAITNLWPKDAVQLGNVIVLGRFCMSYRVGHFWDVNPRIVIGKFSAISWDISSGADGHDCDSFSLGSLFFATTYCEYRFLVNRLFHFKKLRILRVYSIKLLLI